MVSLGWDGAVTIVVLVLGLIVMMGDWCVFAVGRCQPGSCCLAGSMAATHCWHALCTMASCCCTINSPVSHLSTLPSLSPYFRMAPHLTFTLMVGVLMAATVIDTRAGASGFSNTGVLTVRCEVTPQLLKLFNNLHATAICSSHRACSWLITNILRGST